MKGHPTHGYAHTHTHDDRKKYKEAGSLEIIKAYQIVEDEAVGYFERDSGKKSH